MTRLLNFSLTDCKRLPTVLCSHHVIYEIALSPIWCPNISKTFLPRISSCSIMIQSRMIKITGVVRKIDFSLVQRNVIASPKFEKWVYCFHSILRIKSSLQMCCNPTVCFNIRVIKFKFYCNSMIPQPLANFITVFFFQKDEAGSYDNIARTQRFALS